MLGAETGSGSVVSGRGTRWRIGGIIDSREDGTDMSYLGDFCMAGQHDDCGDDECSCFCHDEGPEEDAYA